MGYTVIKVRICQWATAGPGAAMQFGDLLSLASRLSSLDCCKTVASGRLQFANPRIGEKNELRIRGYSAPRVPEWPPNP